MPPNRAVLSGGQRFQRRLAETGIGSQSDCFISAMLNKPEKCAAFTEDRGSGRVTCDHDDDVNTDVDRKRPSFVCPRGKRAPVNLGIKLTTSLVLSRFSSCGGVKEMILAL
jgi:hypothetical protein